MEKPSWTPIVLSGAVPRDSSDLLAILVMGIVALESSFVILGQVGFGSRLLLSILVVPPTCALAAVSTTSRRTREELALLAYGGSSRQILLRYFFRGAICAVVAFSPALFEGYLVSLSVLDLSLAAITLVLAGGIFYSLPSLRRIRSSAFAEHYKS